MTEDGELDKKDVYSLNEEAIAKEAQYDGFYAVCTNLELLPKKEMKKIVKMTKLGK